MYELLVLSRTFDQRALNLQREGRLGTYPSMLGQEASQVGSALAAEKSDWIFPSFRESGVYITAGLPMHLLFQYWSGDERGLKIPNGLNIFPLCIPVGTQVPHGVGVAMAAKYRKDRIAVLVYFGDGGSSRGFSRGTLPWQVFSSFPSFSSAKQPMGNIGFAGSGRPLQGPSRKGIRLRFEGIQVNGNDVLAVFKATQDALWKACGGRRPDLIECDTYRVADHTTADDASRYRPKEEVEMEEQGPHLAIADVHGEKGLWTDDFQKDVDARSKAAVDEAGSNAETAGPPDPRDLFTYTSGSFFRGCQDS
jgi:pyruvate dehydrogenase E1 component alpha subunit